MTETAAISLTHPFREAAVRALPLGAAVSLTGPVYTGRDRLHRLLHDGGAVPAVLRDGALFHCGPLMVPDRGSDAGWRVVAAGPTTSSREDPYMPAIIARHGPRLILGKGGMGAATRAACREHGCAYVQIVGGAAVWVARHVRRVGRVWFLEEFGATEAMWELEVAGLTGIVAIDAQGESLFSAVEEKSRRNLARLLRGEDETKAG